LRSSTAGGNPAANELGSCRRLITRPPPELNLVVLRNSHVLGKL
jgi:hypothetical protein